MSDNPFLEPDDGDRTVIRPSPGGRPAPAPTPRAGDATVTPPPRRATPPPGATERGASGQGAVESVAMGVNPLIAAAAPLLQLLARLRNTASQPDPADLRERAVRAMRSFEQQTRDAQLPMEVLRPAHYALCASLDDVVMNTPWGGTGVWDTRSLVSTFHQEVRSGERFFDLLAQARQNPGQFLPVLELMYLCISLGFQGRYRLSPRGPAELDRLREDTYAVIRRQRQAPEPDLSPHWQGVAAPYRGIRMTLPVWVVASASAALLALVFVYLSLSLGNAADAAFGRMAEAPPATMPKIIRAAVVVPQPPKPPPPQPKRFDKLCTFLQPEVDQKLLTVSCNAAASTVLINSPGMFASGSATIAPRFVPLLRRVAAGLEHEKGQIRIIGYTDNVPIHHNIRFPSNFALSAARADAAKAFIAPVLKNPGRVSAEGRGAADPIASNATKEGRAENRRIEIVLQHAE